MSFIVCHIGLLVKIKHIWLLDCALHLLESSYHNEIISKYWDGYTEQIFLIVSSLISSIKCARNSFLLHGHISMPNSWSSFCTVPEICTLISWLWNYINVLNRSTILYPNIFETQIYGPQVLEPHLSACPKEMNQPLLDMHPWTCHSELNYSMIILVCCRHIISLLSVLSVSSEFLKISFLTYKKQSSK